MRPPLNRPAGRVRPRSWSFPTRHCLLRPGLAWRTPALSVPPAPEQPNAYLAWPTLPCSGTTPAIQQELADLLSRVPTMAAGGAHGRHPTFSGPLRDGAFGYLEQQCDVACAKKPLTDLTGYGCPSTEQVGQQRLTLAFRRHGFQPVSPPGRLRLPPVSLCVPVVQLCRCCSIASRD